MVKIVALISLFVVLSFAEYGCSSKNLNNKQKKKSKSSIFFNWYKKQNNASPKLYKRYSDYFLGLGIDFDKNKITAKEKAKLRAKGELTKTLETTVQSLIKQIQSEKKKNGIIIYQNDIQSLEVTFNNVNIRHYEYIELDSIIDNRNRYCFSMLALIKKNEYKNDIILTLKNNQNPHLRRIIENYFTDLCNEY